MSYVYSTYSPTTAIGGYTVNTTSTANIAWSGSSLIDNADIKPATLHVKGNSEFENDANFQGDLKLKGKSLKESLEKIEDRLAILHPNEELEEKWENLRGLRKMYMELEAEIIEKEKMWAILKK